MNAEDFGKHLALFLRFILVSLLALTLVLAACAAPAAQPTATPQAKSAAPANKTESPATPTKAAPTPTVQVKVEKIKLGYSSTDPSPTPLWIAKERGFLLKNGLDAELVFAEGGTKAVQTMIAGDVAFAVVGGSGIVEAATSGADLVIVATMGSTYPYKLISTANIKKPEDLKGKRLGVSKFGSSSDFALRQALKVLKLDPVKDVNILQIGGDSVRTAALQGGSIDATVLNPPGTSIVAKAGFNVLLEMATIPDLDYQFATMAANKAFVKQNPEITKRFMKAIVEAIHFEKTNKEETKRIIAKYSQLDDPDGLEESYTLYNGPNSRMLAPAPYPNSKGVQAVIDEVLQGKSDAKKINLTDVVDDSFVKELDQSGYIKSLYENK